MIALELEDITKTFPNGTRACDGCSISVEPGETLAVIGENGAGKSTLMRIAFGLEHADSGIIRRNGIERRYRDAGAAMDDGIGMVHQAFQQVPSFTVAENVVLGAEPVRTGIRLDRSRAIEETVRLAESFGLHVDPNAIVGDLPVGLRQRVEILRALYRGAQVLILDEPTAVLTPKETDDLFVSVDQLTRQDKSVILITHKLREVMAAADQIAVLRDGAIVGHTTPIESSEENLAELMVGRPPKPRRRRPTQVRGDTTLSCSQLRINSDDGSPAVDGLTFDICAGEVFGIAGVEGNGQSELAAALLGLRPVVAGDATLQNTSLPGLTTSQIRALGIGFIPEDRRRTGLALTETIADNIALNTFEHAPWSRRGLLDYRYVNGQTRQHIADYRIKASGPEDHAGSLSGGNAQKVVVARELQIDPVLLVAAQPTRGVDIGAIEFLHAQILDARDRGLAVLLISADLREVMDLSDRIGVLYEGRFTTVIDNPESFTETQIGEYMLGATRNTEGTS